MTAYRRPTVVGLLATAGLFISPALSAQVRNMVSHPDPSVVAIYVNPVPLSSVQLSKFDLAGVSAARLFSGGEIALVNQNRSELKFLRPDGSVRRAFPRTPDGASGFRSLSDLMPISGDTLPVWDVSAGRVTFMSPSGRFLGRVSLEKLADVEVAGARMRPSIAMIGQFANGDRLGIDRTVVYMRERPLWPDSTHGYLQDGAGHILNEVPLFAGEEFSHSAGKYGVGGIRPFGRTGSYAVGDSTWFYSNGIDYVIEIRAIDGAVLSKIVVERPLRRVTRDDIVQVRAEQLERVDPLKRNDYEGAFESMPYPSHFPGYAKLLIDAEGVLWALRSSHLGEEKHWDLFTQQGLLLGEVALPPWMEIMDVNSKSLLVWDRETPRDGRLVVLGLTRRY